MRHVLLRLFLAAGLLAPLAACGGMGGGSSMHSMDQGAMSSMGGGGMSNMGGGGNGGGSGY